MISAGSPASPDNDAIRELRDEVKDLNANLKESSNIGQKFTFAMFMLALVQVLIALFGIVIAMMSPQPFEVRALEVFMIAAVLVIMWYFFKKVDEKVK